MRVKLSRQELEQLWEQGKPCVVQVDGEFDSPNTWIYQVPIRYGEDQLAQHVVGYTDSSGRAPPVWSGGTNLCWLRKTAAFPSPLP